ncbi:unnamed protein product [Thlaspi arvense]|uniref:Protein root UVB sensitive/RUS domain-containing protein n=1 Tax=Thlaspi arvense TaxID=13288 RepID=A0AAU9RX45_THLAR|nr:unnamed protein product [Thlaspi arvense]
MSRVSKQCNSRLCSFSKMGLIADPLLTLALLGAIGVGEKSATVIGATFQWFLRDLTGMLGGVMFTFYQKRHCQAIRSPTLQGSSLHNLETFQWQWSNFAFDTQLISYIISGSNLDSNAKMWRLIADLMNDLVVKVFGEGVFVNRGSGGCGCRLVVATVVDDGGKSGGVSMECQCVNCSKMMSCWVDFGGLMVVIMMVVSGVGSGRLLKAGGWSEGQR